MTWTRTRPGVQRLHAANGDLVATVDRGREPYAWYWWTPWGDVGREPTMGDAKAAAEAALPACAREP